MTVVFICTPWGPAAAQVAPGAPPPPAAPPAQLSAADLETLVGPIALYPDDLLAIILPAATQPLEMVKAQRFLEKRKSQKDLQPDPSMPEPVRNLLNYPDVVKKMNADLDWTDRLGKAVVVQQKDVMDAIQAFRRKALAAGNLKTDDKQIIVVEKEVIKVVQADPKVIYIPQYEPTVVVVPQPAPVVVYYPTAYPVYYYPYPPGTAFATGFFFGATTAFAFGWSSHSIYHHYDWEDLQEDRMDYARESREDWQAHQKEMQEGRQEQQAQRQEQRAQRQEERGQGQTARQEQRAQAQTQRQEQRAQADGQRPGQAGTASPRPSQPQAGSGRQPQRDTWRPSASQTAQAQPRSQPGMARAGEGAGRASAFDGYGSGASASQHSRRGSESRTSSSMSGGSGRAASRPSGGFSGGGGARGGGGRGGRR
jgi:hypothetical protein